MEIRPMKLKVDREEYEVYGRRGGGLRGDKKENKLWPEALERASNVVKKKGGTELLNSGKGG